MALAKRSVVLLLFLAAFSSVQAGLCPAGCQCDDENLHVTCLDANLDIVPITLNPSVQKLILRNNRIRSVDTGFSFYHELTHIDLSHNHLLKILPRSFSTQTKLNELHLNNNKITYLSNFTFGGGGTGNREGLPALAILNLNNNLLESLESGVFMYARNLQELDLGQNSIRELNSSALLGLDKLRILKLNNNELSRVPSVFSNGSRSQNRGVELSHLVELFLGMNLIERLESDAFSGVPHLSTLDLKGCRLNYIDAGAFRGLSLLKKLVLSDNNLKAIPSASFPSLKQLETLRIGRNPITTLGAYTFSSLPKLKTLEMDGAPELVSVDVAAFISNLDLETVELSSGKKLSSLPPRLFKGITIKNLRLQENALMSLPEDLASWQSLRSLRLEGNLFRCSCDLVWLRDLLQMDKFKNSSVLVLCNEPLELHEKRINSLSDKDLDCILNGPAQKAILGVSISVAIILLIIFFFLMYRYHDSIKSTCKRKCFRRGRSASGARKNHRGAASSAVKAAELDTSTKTSFLSQSAYPYSDEEYALRTSLMPSNGHGQGSGGAPFSSHTLSMGMNPHSLHRQHQPAPQSYNLHSLGHHQGYHPGHQIPYGPQYVQSHPNGALPNYTEAEYETPHVNLGVGGLNLNFPHHYASPSHHHQSNGHGHHVPIHYNSHQQAVKPIPITEL